MRAGYNKATKIGKVRWLWESEGARRNPCVFLSHKSQDKAKSREIANYLSEVGVDY
jgi:hypothetical protein